MLVKFHELLEVWATDLLGAVREEDHSQTIRVCCVDQLFRRVQVDVSLAILYVAGPLQTPNKRRFFISSFTEYAYWVFCDFAVIFAES